MTEVQEPYIISKEEPEDTDALLTGSPDIEVHLPAKIIAGYKDRLYEKENTTWIKLSITFRDKWLRLLQGSKLAVFLAIALHIDENGQSFPGIELISKETGYSERQIIRAIKQLEDQGLLEVTRIYLGNKVSRNFYNVKAFVSYGYDNPKEQSAKMSLAKDHQSDITSINNVANVTLSRTIKKNHNTLQKELQEVTQTTAKKNGDDMDKEEIMKGNEQALMRSLISNKSDYANYPEDVRPWVQKYCELRNAKPPNRGGEKARWITSGRELADACGEFGLDMLDELNKVFYGACVAHNGIPPFNVDNPGALVKTARGFAASKRRGEKYIFNYPRESKPEHRSLLDF